MINVGDVYWYKRVCKFQVFTISGNDIEVEITECEQRPEWVGKIDNISRKGFESNLQCGIHERVES